MSKEDIYCLDIGTHSVKVALLRHTGEIIDSCDLNVRSSVTCASDEGDYVIRDFIPKINQSFSATLESTLTANDVTKDAEGFPKIGRADGKSFYPEELLLHLLKKVKDKSDIRNVAVNIKSTEVTKCAMILAGFPNYPTVLESFAITSAFLTTKEEPYKAEKLLAIDLGCSALKLYCINIDGKCVECETKAYCDWSCNEFTVALYNYVSDLCQVGSKRVLMDECENAKEVLGAESSYYFETSGVLVTVEDFERCINPTVQRMTYKVKEFLKHDLDSVSNIVLVGGSFNIPLVRNTIDELFDFAKIADIKVNPKCTIAYGMAAYVRKCNNV